MKDWVNTLSRYLMAFALLIIAFRYVGTTEVQASTQPRWRYKLVHIQRDNFEGILDRGWEPVSVGGNQYNLYVLLRKPAP